MGKFTAMVLVFSLLSAPSFAKDQAPVEGAEFNDVLKMLLSIQFFEMMGASVGGLSFQPDSLDRQLGKIRSARDGIDKSAKLFNVHKGCFAPSAREKISKFHDQARTALKEAEISAEASFQIVNAGFENEMALGCTDQKVLKRWMALKRMEALAKQEAEILQTLKSLGWSEENKWDEAEAIGRASYKILSDRNQWINSSGCENFRVESRRVHQAFLKAENALTGVRRYFILPHAREQDRIFEGK